ncbi:MAG: HAD family hydrolase [Cyanobacteriota bacterium]|nr:HAD family hydrolase [Cyanobacteriota bacterium]
MSAASPPLLVFDFDGVLVDGMPEYWWSARMAALQLDSRLDLPDSIPHAFRRLRPLIHQGWEMVLMAAELGRSDFDLAATLRDYDAGLHQAQARQPRSVEEIQWLLEEVRRQAIIRDAEGWLALHRFYPGVPERLRRLENEGCGWMVLTTKGGDFARRILTAADLSPLAVHGHEQGSKPQVLERLLAEQPQRPIWFLEDRRPTLERVRATVGLESVRCYLVAWGYLAPGDDLGLGVPGIHWLEASRFGQPLATWP